MNSENRPTLDPGALVRDLLGDLRALVRQPDGPGRDGEGMAQLRQLGATLREQREAGAAQLAARYRERTDSMRQMVALRQHRMEAYTQRLRQAVPPEPGKYILAGHLTDSATGVAMPNVSVRPRGDAAGDEPETTRSDALGYFRLELGAPANAAGGAVQIEVLDDEGNVLSTSDRQFRTSAGGSDFAKLEVAGERIPRSLALGRLIEGSVDERIKRLERTGRVMQLDPAAGGVGSPAVTPASPVGGVARHLREVLVAHRSTSDDAAHRDARVAARRRSSAPAGRRVIDVRGIGPTYATRLEEEGITELHEVASISPARLADLLNVGERQAAVLIDDAQRLLGGG